METTGAADRELSALREHLDRYRAVTLQTLEYVPDDKLDWRPAEGLYSLGGHFLHIVQVHDFYLHGLLLGDWDFQRITPYNGPLERHEVQPRLEAARSFAAEHLARLDPAHLNDVMQVPNVPVPWTLRDWLWYLVEHEVHHKAQVALALRLIGIEPPFFAYIFPKGVRPDIRR